MQQIITTENIDHATSMVFCMADQHTNAFVFLLLVAVEKLQLLLPQLAAVRDQPAACTCYVLRSMGSPPTSIQKQPAIAMQPPTTTI